MSVHLHYRNLLNGVKPFEKKVMNVTPYFIIMKTLILFLFIFECPKCFCVEQQPEKEVPDLGAISLSAGKRCGPPIHQRSWIDPCSKVHNGVLGVP